MIDDTWRKRKRDTESINTPTRLRNRKSKILGGSPMGRGLSRFSIPLIVAMLMSFVSVLGMSANAATLPTKLINGNFEYPPR